MKYNFNKPLLDLDSLPIKNGDAEVNLGKALASHLINQTKGEAFKLFDWAKSLHKDGIIDLDRSDSKALREIIEKLDTLTVLFKAQLLEIFEETDKKNKVE